MTRTRIVHEAAGPEYHFIERCHITELWNTADDPLVSVAQARVTPGVTTRRHRLAGISERYVIRSGSGEVEVGTLAPVPVQAGDVVLIPPDTAQRIRNTGPVDLIFLAICTPRFTPAAYEDIDTEAPE